MVQINKGIYGLPQAGKLAQNTGTSPSNPRLSLTHNSPCLFKHSSSNTFFTLVVDDFLENFKDRIEAERLVAVLKQDYSIKDDWTVYLAGVSVPRRVRTTLNLSNSAAE
jgi:hypothetical protein